MADTTIQGRPAWVILLVLAALVAVILIAGNALLGDTGNDTNTDPLVNELCEGTDC